MTSLKQIEDEVKVALKAGDKTRVTVLRGFVNTVKTIAKNDGNREPTDADVITAGNRIIKQARETLSFIPVGDATNESRGALLGEIEIVESFLPQKMDRTQLSGLIETILASSPVQGKAAKGFIMKTLNSEHRGTFDAAMANEIVTEKVQA
jgi:uncharacterized protein YqeY